MTMNPFGGRLPVSTTQAPYANALEITPDDDHDLPVIPSAIYVPPFIKAKGQAEDGGPMRHADGSIIDDPEGKEGTFQNVYPWSWNAGGHREIRMLTQNGSAITLYATDDPPPLILPVRPRRILRTGTHFQRIVLLW